MRLTVRLSIIGFSLGLFALAGCEASRRVTEAEASAAKTPDTLTDEQRLNVLAARVQTGEITSEQAGCEYRLGRWDDKRKVCLTGPGATATPRRP